MGLALAGIGIITASAQPVITTQPRGLTNVAGTTVLLSVEATGTPPLAYQWRRGTLALAGETNTTLVIANLQNSTAGNYSVVVTNGDGAVTSTVASVRVVLAPTISTQPSPPYQLVSPGATVTYSVTANSLYAPLAYQWRLNEVGLPDRTNAALVLTNVQVADGGAYTVVVTNLAGAVTSQVARLEVDALFTKITNGPLVSERNYAWHPCWGDYDQDGDLDVFLAARFNQGSPGPNLFYRNNGDGTFSRLTANEAGALAGDQTRGDIGLWLDYDRDGDLDFFLDGPSERRVYQNDGQGHCSLVTVDGFTPLTSVHTVALAAADYDNDGWTDLFLGTGSPSSGRLATLLHNEGNGAFSNVTAIPWRLGCEQYASWCDYDVDGDLDLVIGSYNPPSVNQYAFIGIYTNSGSGSFGPLLTFELSPAGHPAWADYDNDGDMDLLAGAEPALIQLRNDTLPDGSHQLTRITDGPLTLSVGICPSWGDYDNDGWLDLFVTRGFETGDPGLLFHNNGDGTFRPVTNTLPVTERMHSFGCSWVDYDNNGFLDLSICNPYNELACLFRNNGNTNHWLILKLRGTLSNTDAIGAKVRLQAQIGGQTFWQMREIAGLWEDRRAHFGLGDATQADVVRIEWPSGLVQELRDLAADQILTVIEPFRLEVTGPAQFRLRGCQGQVSTVEASTDLATWNAIATVTNLTGTVEFVDPDGLLAPQKFYRVAQP